MQTKIAAVTMAAWSTAWPEGMTEESAERMGEMDSMKAMSERTGLKNK
jgi:hypothetical protein